MANEFSISIGITAAKNGAKYQRSVTFSSDMEGDGWVSGVQLISSAGEDVITHEDITDYGWMFLKNCGAVIGEYVDFYHEGSADTDDTICRLYAGESCILKSAGEVDLHAKSSSASQRIEYAIFEL